MNSEEYLEWFDTHKDNCSANHQGSSGKMEVDAIREIFERSVPSYGVKYLNYIGDGDSRTYKGVVDASLYGSSVEISKKECVEQVQKRMGTWLHACKKKIKGLGGRGKLTGKLIDELTVYYDLTIRRNSDFVEKIKDAIWATIFHKSSTDEEPKHDKCPPGQESWCSWQRAKATDSLKNYNHRTPLHSDVVGAIRPIYESLTEKKLLQRCFGGFTQNSNESLIWRIAPEGHHSGAAIFKIAANIAACTFNEGAKTLMMIMK
ncbi:hypothetical protein J437_LFUL008538 [Ladona fulva]|uniref:Mutator-like transposase domain-containing protein n=1 Tax=Ladona fulva TaxID=123851 RepID=A0A8K0KA35_LADFU|nr:hypothetical protein J437_LFUL008538 [Ladona fulva]